MPGSPSTAMRARRAAVQRVERGVEPRELGVAADDRAGAGVGRHASRATLRRSRVSVQGASPMFAGRRETRLAVTAVHTDPRDPHAIVTQPRSPRWTLERAAPQDRPARLDRLRRPRLRGRRQGRHEHPDQRRRRRRRVRPGRPHRRRRISQARGRGRPHPELEARRPTTRRSAPPSRTSRGDCARSTASRRSPTPTARRRGAISPKRDAVLVSFQIPGDCRGEPGRDRIDRGQRRRRRRGAEGASRPARRAVGQRQQRGASSRRSSRRT